VDAEWTPDGQDDSPNDIWTAHCFKMKLSIGSNLAHAFLAGADLTGATMPDGLVREKCFSAIEAK
jgi:hypothetical protein